MNLRKAKTEEWQTCCRFIEDAKAYQAQLGFFQWGPQYPAPELIREDIAGDIGYCFTDENDSPIGYCCIIVGEEPAYRQIEGSWAATEPYVVVHRMALAKEVRGKGISGEAFDLIKAFTRLQGLRSVRMDTQEENTVMRHILEREGFVHRGFILFDNGPKFAYELNL